MTTLILDNDLDHIECLPEKGNSDGGFLLAAYRAFCYHKILVIDPETFLQALIAQASVLISKNAEQLRYDLVTGSGKETLVVMRPTENVWREFAQKIKIENEQFRKLLNLTFSTTTDDTLDVRSALIMATFSPYYDYDISICGLRGVTVEGTVQDWTSLKVSLDGFKFLEKVAGQLVSSWIANVSGLIERCIDLLNGCGDSSVRQWWKSFVTEDNWCDGPYLGGHILKMVLIDSDGELISKPYDKIAVDDLPHEQLSLTLHIDYEDRDVDYFVGNFCELSKDRTSFLAKPRIMRDKNMTKVNCRLGTFDNWPLNSPSPRELAEAGFCYTGNKDVVSCPYCGLKVYDWLETETDNPWNTHKKYSFNCSFLGCTDFNEFIDLI